MIVSREPELSGSFHVRTLEYSGEFSSRSDIVDGGEGLEGAGTFWEVPSLPYPIQFVDL